MFGAFDKRHSPQVVQRHPCNFDSNAKNGFALKNSIAPVDEGQLSLRPFKCTNTETL